jgi:cytochrome P450
VLVDEIRPAAHPARLIDFTFRLPVYVIASLLGIPAAQLPQTALLIDDFVRCLSPLSSPEQIEQSKSAAGQLLELFDALLRSPEAEHSDGLLPHLAREAQRAGAEERAGVIANGIGFLSQAYEATAGLIGNTLLGLARHGDVYEQVLEEVDTLPLVIREVLRFDPSVQNTRRYLAEAGTVAGKEMHSGDTVLVVLAAANRDPTANAAPERFELLRKNRRLFTFGAGVHGCPGDMIATAIARAGVAQLLQAGLDVPRLAENVTYRPSVNVRIPLFAEGGTQ